MSPSPAPLQHDEPIFLERLKRETRPAHDSIEANIRLARLTAPDLQRSEYVAILARLWGFHRPVEAQLQQLLGASGLGLALERRQKAHLLEHDLSLLGAPIETAPCCPWRLREDAAAAWGVLYVLEGATLGGRMILKHLQSSLGLGPDTGAAYYAGYGAETGAMWQGFRARLGAVCAERPHWEARVLAGALATYREMDAWVAGD